MIGNDEQLELVRQQIGRLEAAVHSLSRTVRPRSEAQFRAFAEGYVDQLQILRAEVDDYLGVTAASATDIAAVAAAPAHV